ncbi:MAG: PAS domain S-box protein [Proteobacteria bacterium]|nr:PAS domain S-box protein [Pseudomonadota bacterium]
MTQSRLPPELAVFAFEKARDAIMCIEADGRFHCVNQAACRTLGFSKDVMLNMRLTDVDAELAGVTWTEWRDDVGREGGKRYESFYKTGKGGLVPLWVSVSALAFEGRDYLCLFARDITGPRRVEGALRQIREELELAHRELEDRVEARTAELRAANERLKQEIAERERAREALRLSEQKYRLLSENTHDGVAVVQDGRVVHANSRLLERSGFSLEELMARPIAEFLYPDDRQAALDPMTHLLRDEPSDQPALLRVFDGKGRLVWVRSSAVRIEWEGRDALLFCLDDITELKQALEEKDLFLKEIHHRVKNNMQVISSLVKLQGDTVKDRGLEEVFRECQCRIKAMALIHEIIYRSGSLSELDMGPYVTSLAHSLFEAYDAWERGIRLEISAESLSLSQDLAVPCGLILNELLSNACKHAFPDGRAGLVEVTVRAVAGDEIELAVADDGVGLPAGEEGRERGPLGLYLVRGLAEHQLRGRLEVERRGGTRFTVAFHREGKKKGA